MSNPSEPVAQPHRLPVRAKLIAGVLLVIPLIALALVPTYSSETPKLWGFPFFYWYQLAWVFLAAGCCAIAFGLLRWEKNREARR